MFAILYFVALTHPHPPSRHVLLRAILALHHLLDHAMIHHRLITFNSRHEAAFLVMNIVAPGKKLFCDSDCESDCGIGFLRPVFN